MKHMKRKALLLAVCAALLLTAAIGGTTAFIVANTNQVKNEFTPGGVPIEVKESFDGKTKSNVQIKNNGNVPAFIRAKVVVTWKDSSGNVSGTPVKNGDYVIEYNQMDWKKEEDGFWYYTQSVPASGMTNALITNCTKTETAPEGYDLSVEILAESIQAEGMDAADAQDAFDKALRGRG